MQKSIVIHACMHAYTYMLLCTHIQSCDYAPIYIHVIMLNHWPNFNQTKHKASLGEGDSSLLK